MYYSTTSRTRQQQSVLASLRALVPQRPLTPSESFRIAELQANRLLERFAIETPAVPDEIVSELPRIRVVSAMGYPVSGSAHWNGRCWIITISGDEPHVRQRFSLMHEFKHVLDHTTKLYLYRDRPQQSAAEQAERVADYFAACALMPKRMLQNLWYGGDQILPTLAAKLHVSVPALRYRLTHLGLIEPAPRCERRVARLFPTRPLKQPKTYFRRTVLFPAVGGLA